MNNQVELVGLTEQEVSQSLEKYGKNVFFEEPKFALLKLLLKLVLTPINGILLVSSSLAFVFGEQRDAVIIFFMVLLSVGLDFFQEYKSNNAAKKLNSKIARKTEVIRDSQKLQISVQDIVPGDLVVLSIGDILCADGVVVKSSSLLLNESALSGESLSVEKSINSEVFAGTIVSSGSGFMRVTATGLSTKFGEISKILNQKSDDNSYEKGVKSFSWIIFRVIFWVILGLFLVNVIKLFFRSGGFVGNDLVDIVLFAITLAVGLTPELLPLIMSITKTKTSLDLAKKGVLIKKLNSIPSLGSMDVLCTDKTGTLTENQITLVKYIDAATGVSSNFVLELGFLNSFFQTGCKNQLDEAILKNSVMVGKNFERSIEIPFDFERKMLSVVVKNSSLGTQFLVSKGQVEEVLKKSSWVCESFFGEAQDLFRIAKNTAGQGTGLDSTNLDKVIETDNISKLKLVKIENCISKLEKLYSDLSKDGYRVLGVGFKQTQNFESGEVLEKDLVFAGFLAFLDNPKLSAGSAIAEILESGVAIKIITGDNELVSRKVCKELNIPIYGVALGDDWAKLNALEKMELAQKSNLFARFTPLQKEEVILNLKKAGHVVGYMGDGINDAPSLKASDVGISVDNAVDVAREEADIILLSKDLKILKEGILGGRMAFANTIKYMLMAFSSNFGNIISISVVSVFLPFLPVLPVQILLNNTLYDISQVTIPTDTVDDEMLAKPQKWSMGFLKKFMLVFGLVSSSFDLLYFYIAYQVMGLSGGSFQTLWFIESVITQISVIYIIRTKKIPFFQSRPSRFLLLSTLAIMLIAILIPYSFLATQFGFVPLPVSIIAFILLINVIYLCCVEVTKQWFFKKYHRL